ncbi:hypothetical protein FACS18945_5370 [Bacteroidia bacterium]|nr:hypothetical protein FACS18945_5370 [Bacteroidia bacterium]
MDNEYGKISEEFITQRINWHGKHEPDTTNEAYMEFRQSVERLRENLSDEQRLLLRECENAYHVVDGETERFYYKYGLMDAIRFLLHFGEDES